MLLWDPWRKGEVQIWFENVSLIWHPWYIWMSLFLRKVKSSTFFITKHHFIERDTIYAVLVEAWIEKRCGMEYWTEVKLWVHILWPGQWETWADAGNSGKWPQPRGREEVRAPVKCPHTRLCCDLSRSRSACVEWDDFVVLCTAYVIRLLKVVASGSGF